MQFFLEREAAKVLLDRVGVASRDPRENLVQSLGTAHLLDLLEDHRRKLAVALGKDRVGPLGEREDEGRAAPSAPFRLADHQALALEVGEVLADRVGRHAEVVGDRFRAGPALAPKQLEDFHAGRTAGDHQGHIRSLRRDSSTGLER